MAYSLLKFVLSPRFDDLFGAEFVDFLLDAVKVPTPPVIIVAAIAHQKPIIPFLQKNKQGH